MDDRHADIAEQVWQREAPRVVAALTRRWDDFAAAEDATQDALAAAARQWPVEGVPADPRAWLVRVASRRMIDSHRSARARRRREEELAADPLATGDRDVPDADDTLTVLMMCCHPSLTPASQVALALRAVAGLDTAQVARAFVVPEATMAQRISRAKAAIAKGGATLALPPAAEAADRLRAVLHVLYLVFTEGHSHTGEGGLLAVDLSDEAIRLCRQLHRALPSESEITGLLALMLLTDARRPARLAADGSLVPLDQQYRSRWDRGLIAEGLALVAAALPHGIVGQYQLQAAIAAVHAEAPTAAETDWPQILALYDLLREVAPGPVVELNRAVAVGMVDGPEAGLAATDRLADALDGHHRWHAVRGHLLARAGRQIDAAEAFTVAAALTSAPAERAHLVAQASSARTAAGTATNRASHVERGDSAPTSAHNGPTNRPDDTPDDTMEDR